MELKAKVVSLEAQLVEKSNKISAVEKELDEFQKGSRVSSSSPKSVSVDAQYGQAPVLLSDPAGETIIN